MVGTVTAEDLRDLQDSDEEYELIDMRFEDQFDDWHIKGAKNIPFMEFEEDPDSYLDEIPEDEPVYLLCAEGGSSEYAAEMLEERGYDNVYNVEGGMKAWSAVYDVTPVATQDDDIEIVQLQRRSKGCLGYIVGDKATGEAAAIDVTRHTNEYKDAAAERGFEITKVFDTHIHADHISGGSRLADELDVPYHLGSPAETRNPGFDYDPVEPNHTVEVGNVSIKAVHTPGHTTGSTSWLVEDEALMTGDTLFVESVGRTELQFSGEDAEDASTVLYDTLQNMMSQPDTVKILPAHFSVTDDGEFIDVTPGTPMVSTVGKIRTSNEMIQMDKDEYVEAAFENMPSKPPNYEDVIAINEGKQELEGEEEATNLELGPNRCAATEESVVADD
ncbi:MAG: rhodanese-like domain-containing protein [Halobacteria archaeon]|nr:rhodanese-like domain-containing protein [Halobacteria archaeon]